ncbi:MAG: FAD-dependent monooxygenase [Proteobacteria bacterium]|jgi:2-octaprenyl-6-methoxyphenol hydroxylase|nr:FAD-dependent monooxygenase [Pseudomonadota bacterium]
MKTKCEILVCGGGIAGLLAANIFASKNYKVICVDPSDLLSTVDQSDTDFRSTAFLQPSIELLQDANIWRNLLPFATPLKIMRIIDAGGPDGRPRTVKEFDSSEISEKPFGWNLQNHKIRHELYAKLQSLPNVEIRHDQKLVKILTRTTQARAYVSDGTVIDAQLILGADGRNSFIRNTLGINSKTQTSGQKALVFTINHTRPHKNISTEIHMSGGPFTFVPLQDFNKTPCSAVVWMEQDGHAAELLKLSKEKFEIAATQRSCGILGNITLVSNRSIWPIITQVAEKFCAERVALIGEAAHVIPPIGAQGLNMSLADIGLLSELSDKHDLGNHNMLKEYNRKRRISVNIRAKGISLLNSVSMSETQWIKDLRNSGLGVIYDSVPIRKKIMQLGVKSL